MSTVIDIVGTRFGLLTVVEKTNKYYEKGRAFYYRCICDCGNERLLLRNTLVRGFTKSCGCNRSNYTRHNQWSGEELQIVKDFYGKINYHELLKMLPKRGFHNVRKMAEKLGLTEDRQKYTYNHNYFTELTHENCYWAGFLAADGSINIDKSNQPTLSVTLQARDKTHIEKFVSAVDYTKPVQNRVSKLYDKTFAQAVVAVYGCRQWVKDLNEYFNITPNKSLTLQPPNLTERQHIISFLAGYIDGDGTIYYATNKYKGNVKKGKLVINWLGTHQLLEWSKTQIDAIIGPGKNNVNKHKGIWQYGISGERAEFLKSMVLGMGLPVLERKWLKEWRLQESL